MDAGADARIDVAETQPEDGSGSRQEKPTAGQSPFASLLGDVAWLMVRSPAHRHLFLADLIWGF